MILTGDAELYAAVTEMIGEAKKLRAEVTVVAKAGKRNRRMIWLTIASVLFDVLISILLGWNIAETNRTSDKTDAVASTKAEVCRAFNDRNSEQRALWKAILERVPAGETPEQQALREDRNEELQPVLAKAFAPIDCDDEP